MSVSEWQGQVAASASRRARISTPSGSTALLAGLVVYILVFLIFPLALLLRRSLENSAGEFVGAANYVSFLSHPSALRIIGNSLFVAAVATFVTVLLALAYAFAISRTCMRLKTLFRSAALLPLLTPSLLSAMAMVQLFGNQGYLREFLFGHSIYGPIGIVVGMIFAHFPHVFVILMAAVALADARLYETAECMGTGRIRMFATVTLPNIKYGLISSAVVSFTLCLTDFGIPKVIGGSYDVLATEIYKQVVGQQNFQMGAVVSILLLIPAVVAFSLDRLARGRQATMMSAKAVPLVPRRRALIDNLALLYCTLIALALIALIVVPAYASFTAFWPYKLDLTLRNYQFDLYAGGGWESYLNSLRMALATAIIGTAAIFVGAYLSEKSETWRPLKLLYQIVAIVPMSVPGLVIGLSYIFFLNNPQNPLEVLYGTMSVLVISTIVHYYTVGHLTAVTALRQLDDEFEAVSDSLRVPRRQLFFRVTVPICLPALLDISIYLFLNAMTTVSAVIFLYSYDTTLASVAVINMDDAGEYAPAAAMAVIIVVTCIIARCLHLLVTHHFLSRARAWMFRGSSMNHSISVPRPVAE
jgi:iron(III) transport system permease protein